MAGATGDVQGASAFSGVAADAHSLDQLRLLAARDPGKAVRQVATQFEALFLQQVLKSMRDATPKSGLLDSSEQETYTSMLDSQIAQKVAAGGTGLGDVIARQLSRNLPSAAAASQGPAAAAPAGAPARAAPAAPAGDAAHAADPATGRMLQMLRAAATARSGQ